MRLFLKQKRLYFIGAGLIALAITLISSRISPNINEWYTNHIYPIFAFTIGKLTGMIPFSVAEIIIVTLPMILAGYTIFSIIFMVKKDRGYIRKFIANALVLVSVFYGVFVLLCGVNYNRVPISETYQLELKPRETSILIELCGELIENTNLLKRESLLEQGQRVTPDILKKLAKETQHAYKVLENLGILKSGYYGELKSIFFSKLMSYTNIVGFFFPYTFEANIDIDVPIYTIPATMAHEIAHLRGYMKEDEANFIAYLACMNSENVDLQYSGTMLALTHSLNALYKVDSHTYSQLFSFLSGDVMGDIAFNSEYWNQFDGKISEVSTKVNNSYLKSQNQHDGVQSYGKVVDLLIAEYIKRNK
ncbi:MAG: DUF3810 domain-containing protein [Oscillospiraceae bacterium]